MTEVLFAIYALVTCGGAIGVVACQNVVRMATSLTIALGGVAGLFLLAGAEFVAAAQLLVYVGGTAIVLVFGVMLTAKESFAPPRVTPNELIVAIAVASAMFAVIAGTALRVDWPEPPTADGIVTGEDNVKPLGLAMLGIRADSKPGYLFPFEIVSLHLLVVLIGAGYMARATRTLATPSKRSVEADASSDRPPSASGGPV